MLFVVDASFLGWAMFEQDPARQEEVDSLQQTLSAGAGMHAPRLIVYELGNMLRKILHSVSFDKRASAHQALLNDVTLWDGSEEQVGTIHQLAEHYNLTFYDASYLELAGRDDASVLITQDNRLVNAAKRALGKNRAFMGAEAFSRFANTEGTA